MTQKAIWALGAVCVLFALAASSAQASLTSEQWFELATKAHANKAAQELKRLHNGVGGIHTGYIKSKNSKYSCEFQYPKGGVWTGSCVAYTERRRTPADGPCGTTVCNPWQNGIRFWQTVGMSLQKNLTTGKRYYQPTVYPEYAQRYFLWPVGGGKGIGVPY